MLARLLPSTSLTRRGTGFLVCAAAALLAGWVMGRRDLLTLAVFLAALPAASVVLLRLARPRLDIRRSFTPPVVEAGAPATVRLAVSAPRLPVASVTMHEGLPARFGQSPAFHFPPLSARGALRADYEYRLRSSRRGVYRIGPAGAVFTDPFGLARAHQELGGSDRLVVAPAPLPLPSPYPDAAGGPDGTVLHSRPGGPSDDEAATRGYRPGDPMRRVHWAATARHGQLMVRQEHPISTPWATLLLDRREAAHGRSAAAPVWEESPDLPTSDSFEWCVTMAVSAAAHLVGAGWALSAVDQAGRPMLAGSSSCADPDRDEFVGGAGLQDFAEGLAALGLQPNGLESGQESAFGPPLADRLAEARWRGPLIAVLGTLTVAEARALAALAVTGGQAFALLAVGAPGVAREGIRVLRNAGWQVAAVTPDTPVPVAWSMLDALPAGRAPGTSAPVQPVPAGRPGAAGGSR